MQINKRVAIISSIIACVMLIAALTATQFKNWTFVENCCISLFASGILVAVPAYISYLLEKKQSIYQLYCACMEYTQRAPFGRVLINKEGFLKVFDDIGNANAIYRREISPSVSALLANCSDKHLHTILQQIHQNTRMLDNALIDLNEKMIFCYLQDRDFENFTKNELLVNQAETQAAAEEFAKAVNLLVAYMKKHKIHRWEDDDNAD